MPRGRRTSARRSSGNVVDKEVASLFKMGDKVDNAALMKLRRKYGDDQVVDEIEKVFTHQHERVVKAAKHFAHAVRNKYAHSNVPYHILLQKSRLHARKYKMSAAEFSEFQRMVEQELAGTTRKNEVVVPVTNMMKVLGNLAEQKTGAPFHMGGDDAKNLQALLRMAQETRQLHSQVVLQTLTYGEGNTSNSGGAGPIGVEALNAMYDKNTMNQTDHIHPVLVAMFLRANDEFDNHFIMSNIAGIVKARYNKDHLTTRADYELFYDMVTDPNDIICDNRSPVADLLHRANLQSSLWNCVLNLRNGRTYNGEFRHFMSSVDVCRLNKYDNPDFVYGRHDGTIAKRLVSAFSYRPTVVTTRPAQTMVMANNPYNVNVRPTVTRIPMVTFRVGQDPVTAGNTLDIANELQTTQQQYFIEGNVVVKRQVQILYSRGNVIVYLDRRLNNINLNEYPSMTYSQVPLGVAGFERINDKPVNVSAGKTSIPIGTGGNGAEDNFFLSASVCALTQNVKKGSRDVNAVVGSCTYVSLNDYRQPSTGGATPFVQHKFAGTVVNPVPVAPRPPTVGPLGPNQNTEWVQYNPMNVNNYVSGSVSGPYSRTTAQNADFVTANEKRSLLLIYTAVDLSNNLAVHQR